MSNREHGHARLLHDLKHAPRPGLLDTLNVWINAYRTLFWTAIVCGVAYVIFAWSHRG